MGWKSVLKGKPHYGDYKRAAKMTDRLVNKPQYIPEVSDNFNNEKYFLKTVFKHWDSAKKEMLNDKSTPIGINIKYYIKVLQTYNSYHYKNYNEYLTAYLISNKNEERNIKMKMRLSTTKLNQYTLPKSLIYFTIFLILMSFSYITKADASYQPSSTITSPFDSFNNLGSEHFSESYYVNKYCPGSSEVTNSDNTRTDCIIGDHAIEFDFASKIYECVGQALHYAKVTNKKPTCAAIIEKKSDCKYLQRADPSVILVTIDKNGYCGEVDISGLGTSFKPEFNVTPYNEPKYIYKDKIIYQDVIVEKIISQSCPSTSGSSCHYVNGYTRANGTYVSGYTRCY